MAKYGKVNLGQVEALINLIGGEKVVESILNGTSKITIETVHRLSKLVSATVPVNQVNPYDFFKNRPGLWVSDNFRSFILQGASKKKVSAGETTIGHADLAQDANDAEIGGKLPEDHVFEKIDTFLVHLATLIEVQWGGKEGPLLNNGYANIFYVKVNGEVFAVSVSWGAGRRRWGCGASRLDADRWVAGSRAVSATAA